MYFIINPAAGRGRGRKAFDWLKERLESDDELALSERPGDCERLAKEAAEAGRSAMTAVGGDATVGEVLNGIAAADSEPAVGILPVGTANDLAIYVDIPNDWERALQIVRAGRVRRVDAGVAVRGGQQRYFVTTAGAGINAVIASREQAETDKAAGSPITYVGGVLRELMRYRPIEVEIAGDDVSYRGPILMASVSNGEQEGGIFKLAPGARADDGLLHLLILGDVPTWQRPWYALQSMRGRSQRLAKAQRHDVKAVTLRTVEDTPFYLDGEYEPLPAGEVVEMHVAAGRFSVLAP
jgi:diacylglycerol kinase (ATP)